MGILFTIVPIGIVVSLVAFLIFENLAIKFKKDQESTGLESTEILSKKFEQYNTINYTAYFAIAVFIFTFIIVSVFHDSSYGLIHALLYIFITTFVSSFILFMLKIKKDILIKVFAAFLYGVAHIVGASTAFLVKYILS